MSFAFALLQAATAPDRTSLYILAGMAVLCLLALNLRFFRNMFEVITAPGASLKFHGEDDPFLTSMLLVLMGGVIATLIMFANQQQIAQSFNTYAERVSSDLAAANGNANYRDVAKNDALNRLNSGFDIIVIRNLLAMPFIFMGLWLFIGFFAFLFSKMLSGGATAGNMLGTTAYSSFFMSIGIGLAAVFIVGMIGSAAGAASPTPDAMGIAGLVLIVYALVLFMMGVAQAADITGGQMIGVAIFMLIVLGGTAYGIYHQGTEKFAEFSTDITTFNPATGKI